MTGGVIEVNGGHVGPFAGKLAKGGKIILKSGSIEEPYNDKFVIKDKD